MSRTFQILPEAIPLKYFLDTVGTIAKGVGFQHYDLCHILWLLVFIIITAVCSIVYRHCNERKRQKFRMGIAALLVIDELFKQVCLQLGDNFKFDYLPLHLCSINILLITIHAIKPSKILDNFLYTVCIPGALAALLFPTWTKLPFENFMHIHSFTVHILLALYPIMLTAGTDIRPAVRDIPKTLGFLGILAVGVYGINLLLDTNFMFLMRAPKGNPLYWFEKTFGEHLIGYPILIALVLLIMYIPIVLAARRKKHTPHGG